MLYMLLLIISVNSMKTILIKYTILGTLFLALITCIFLLYKSNKELSNGLSISKSNEKALIIENNGLKDINRVFQFTISQLEYFNDSLTEKMNVVRKELEIKDKDLKHMQYLLSETRKSDTIVFKDTLFKKPSLNIDTLISDKWYQMKLGLKYPSTITVDPKFISEKYIVVNYKKETINPPKKCWISRLFQKKHKVLEVNVVEKSPYIENKQQRFIEIIK